MKITVEFDPAVDTRSAVVTAVTSAFITHEMYEGDDEQPMFNPSEHQASEMAQAVAGMSPTPLASAVAPGASVPATATPASANVAYATSPAGVDLDSTGIPWDARIHSSGKDEDGKPKKTAKGQWAKRKGVADSEVARVTAELLNLMASNAGTHAATPAGGVLNKPEEEPAQTAVEVSPGNFAIQQPAAEQPVVQPSPAAEQPLTPPAGLMPNVALAAPATPTDFPSLMMYLTPNLKSPSNPNAKLEQAHVAQICTHFGLVDANGAPALSLAQQRPDLIKVLHESFENFIKAL